MWVAFHMSIREVRAHGTQRISEATRLCTVVRVFSKTQGRGTVRYQHTIAGKIPKIKAG